MPLPYIPTLTLVPSRALSASREQALKYVAEFERLNGLKPCPIEFGPR